MMKNLEYDLLTLARYKSEILWKIEKHYMGDAQEEDEDIAELLADIKKSDEKQLEQLRAALAKTLA